MVCTSQSTSTIRRGCDESKSSSRDRWWFFFTDHDSMGYGDAGSRARRSSDGFERARAGAVVTRRRARARERGRSSGRSRGRSSSSVCRMTARWWRRCARARCVHRERREIDARAKRSVDVSTRSTPTTSLDRSCATGGTSCRNTPIRRARCGVRRCTSTRGWRS